MLRQVITKPFLAVLLAVSAFAFTGLPQEETKEKTFTRDELDAVLIAGRFAREMQRTKDLRPLIAKYGVPKYGRSLAVSDHIFEEEIVSPEFGAKVDPRLIRDLHMAVLIGTFSTRYDSFIRVMMTTPSYRSPSQKYSN